MNVTEISNNLFNKPKYSNRGCASFVYKTISMMVRHNINDKYTERIADYIAALEPYEAKRKTIKTGTGTRIGQTAELNEFMETLLSTTRELHRLAVYVFDGISSSEYKEVFPKGLSIFSRLSRDIVNTELDYLIDKGNKYSLKLGAGFKTAFENLKTLFNKFHSDQIDTISELSEHYVEQDRLREVLTLEITRQYLRFCYENVGNRALVMKFFVFSIFTIHKRHYKNYINTKAEVGAGETQMVEKNMKTTNTIELINNSDLNLKFGGGTEPYAPMTRIIDIPAHCKAKLLFGAIANSEDTFLKVYNENAELSARYVVNVFN